MGEIKLTQYSHGAGCGCKIAPQVLDSILKSKLQEFNDDRILVGNSTKDDAAVYNLDEKTGIISTTDFFMPIVDDPFTFGRIAATNAISDIYAMGGEPLMAIAILGWPIDKLDAEVAQMVVDGGRKACSDAGIVIAGGHSIDSPEPIFGLAVTGKVDVDKIKQNNKAKPGSKLYLTKPLGIGVLTTAEKRGLLRESEVGVAAEIMMRLNNVGKAVSEIQGVSAMTDVTGFGLLGHLSEICLGSNVSAIIKYNDVPKISNIDYYIEKKSMPGGTRTNWQSVMDFTSLADETFRYLLCDPQTSGGLLIAVDDSSVSELESILQKKGIDISCIGSLVERKEKLIVVE